MAEPTTPADKPARRMPVCRVTQNGNVTHVEPGFYYEDDYQILVDWDEREQAWAACLIGFRPGLGGAYGYGSSQVIALANLCCALGATVDCIDDALRSASSPSEPK